MESYRQPTPAEIKVLHHLKQVRASTAKQIATFLNVTPMAVHHHLAVLEKAGLLATALERRRTGRPAYLYSLTDRAGAFFPNEYVDFVNRLLGAIVQLDGQEKVATIFKQMKKNAVAQHGPRMAGKSFEERVVEMAKIQTESGYMADWRRLDDNTFELTENNCAILQVARNCPQACECELRMMQELLGAKVNRQEHVVKGDSSCRYMIQAILPSAEKRSRTRRPATARTAG